MYHHKHTHVCIHLLPVYNLCTQDSVEEEVTMMVQTVLHVLLECFMELCDRMEKYTNTIGHCVSVIMSLFELMAPKHYHLLRNSLHQEKIPNINLEVRK